MIWRKCKRRHNRGHERSDRGYNRNLEGQDPPRIRAPHEIHEAFAAQLLCTLKAWQSPEFCRERLGLAEPLGAIAADKLNVKGSSLATGHPFAATGARIVATLIGALRKYGLKRGVASLCIGGGEATAMALELS